MALVIADRVRETTSSTGTGTITLTGPFSGFQPFSVIGNGNTTFYCIIDSSTGAFEVGIGTYTTSGNTLSRTTVLSSSNSNNLVNFVAGVKDVICTQPAARAVYVDGTNIVANNSATLPITTVGGLGTGIATALAINVGSTGAPVVNGGTASVTTLTATADSAFTSTGSLTVSKGTTGQRPASPVSGMFRFNTTTAEFEGFNGTAFASVGGAALSNDTATASSLFPLFANATTGTAASVFTSNAQYLFKPSLGELSVKAVRASNGIFTNSATVSADATIASGDNGGSFGPTTINSGITLTVSSGSVYTVV